MYLDETFRWHQWYGRSFPGFSLTYFQKMNFYRFGAVVGGHNYGILPNLFILMDTLNWAAKMLQWLCPESCLFDCLICKKIIGEWTGVQECIRTSWEHILRTKFKNRSATVPYPLITIWPTIVYNKMRTFCILFRIFMGKRLVLATNM